MFELPASGLQPHPRPAEHRANCVLTWLNELSNAIVKVEKKVAPPPEVKHLIYYVRAGKRGIVKKRLMSAHPLPFQCADNEK